MNNSGHYALVALDGAPVPSASATALGFQPDVAPILARAVDDVMPAAINVSRSAGRVTQLIGYFDESEALCEALRLPRGSEPVTLARAGLARFAADLPDAAIGEWSLLDWQANAGLTVMSSVARRDPTFIARHGNLIAVAPSLHALGKLDWLDRTIDEEGIIASLGNYRLRREFPDRTLLHGVRRLPPGGSITWNGQGERVGQSRQSSGSSCFSGSIHEAMDEVTDLLRRIVGQRLDRTGDVGCLLSGGLDSTLIAWLLADQTKSHQSVSCLCSSVDSSTGLADEVGKARIVADRLCLPLEAVVPAPDLSPYRPQWARFERGAGLVLDPRHYLYDALGERAAEQGIVALFDGCFGEGTVTAHLPVATLRYRLRELARRIAGRPDVWAPHPGIAIVKLAPHRLSNIQRTYGQAMEPIPADAFRAVDPRGPWIFPPGADMRSAVPTEMLAGRVRLEFPFRDARLLKLFSGFPAAFMHHRSLDRAPVRLILKSRVLDSIRLQGKGLPFSPDYDLRLRNHAASAADRIRDFRRVGIDDWLDLDWLGNTLGAMAANGPQGLDSSLEIQFTAMAAEFLYWWRNP